MISKLKKHINNQLPFLKQAKLLVTISGGIDSVVLTYLCYELKLDIALAHCNFNLRKEESDTDENFVLQLAKKLNIKIYTKQFNTVCYASEHKISIQVAARELRYSWFEELADSLGFDYVLTAHHADDNLETVLINFTRGTGLEGLTGIPVVNKKIVRPLLPFSRNEIFSFAKSKKINWRDDSSNKSVKYLRNKLRHEVIPILKEVNSSLLQSFQMSIAHLNDSSLLVRDRVEWFLKRAKEESESGETRFDISEFKKLKQPKAYLFEVFKAYGFTQWNDVLNLLDAQSGKQVFSTTHRLIKDREYLLLSKKPKTHNDIVLINTLKKEIDTPIGKLIFNDVKTILPGDNNTVFIDKDLIKFPLELRKKKEGDIFYPFGMKGKKKLSKYFKDEKFSLLDKENIWLLCSNQTIIWVIGKRADNRFRVSDTTKHILKIQLNNLLF